MSEKNSPTHPAIPATYEAFALPIGTLGSIADHTFVYARSAALPSGGCDCRCYGNGIAAAVGPAVLSMQGGDMKIASCMINMIPTIKAVYDGFFDNCGILYGIEGVCHNMTNRILAISTATVLPLGTVHGYILSLIIYGLFGNTPISYMQRSVLAWGIATMAGMLGQELVGTTAEKEVTWVFDPEIFEACRLKMETTLEYVAKLDKSDVLKLLLQMELYGVSTPENRLAALYQHLVLKKDSSKLQNDRVLKSLLPVLTNFMMKIENTARLNVAFQEMNAEMKNILGSADYKTLFLEDYNSELTLLEY